MICSTHEPPSKSDQADRRKSLVGLRLSWHVFRHTHAALGEQQTGIALSKRRWDMEMFGSRCITRIGHGAKKDGRRSDEREAHNFGYRHMN
jgi:hypothetical protein